MPQENTINPGKVCQQAIQTKLIMYQAKEQFETVLKTYNDQFDRLIDVIVLLKNRVLELEGELDKEKTEIKKIKEDKEVLNAE